MDVRLQSRIDTLQVRGWRINSRRLRPETPTFVIIHGVGLSHRPYGRLARALAEHGAVIGVDLPGFGGLNRPASAVSVREFAEVVATLLEAMGVTEYVAVGHSMGVQVALELGLTEQSHANALVLIGPVVDPQRRTLAQQAVALVRDSAKEPLATNLLILRDYLTCGMRWYLTETLEMMRYRTDLRIADSSVPVLVIRGANDPIAPQSWCDGLAESVPEGVSATIAGHRHVVAHTGGVEVAHRIVDFCAGEVGS
jgi:pimeloyl-ACP methyl ester carboxylesterase